MSNAVDHPLHYGRHGSGIECIDVVEWMGFSLGNAAGLQFFPVGALKRAIK